MKEFTPGPWKAIESAVTLQLQIQSGTLNVCGVYATSKGETMPQLANARLISAAPDLLVACRAALAYCYKSTSDNPEKKLESAIAKAVQP